ncbi:MAG: hypothetical protein ACOH10_12235 [Rhodoglobus sp.]
MDRFRAERRASRQDRIAASSVWMRSTLVVVVAVPWMLTLPPALFGDGSNDLAPLAVIAGALVGNSYRDRAFLRLPAASRLKVIAVRRSGQLTGDRTLDAIALNRVQRAARTARLDRFLRPLAVAMYMTGPLVAAVRDTPWWLVCLLPGAVVAAAMSATWTPEDPRVQRDRLLPQT